MSYICYDTPVELKAEEAKLLQEWNKTKEDFKAKVSKLNKEKREARINALKARKWKLAIEYVGEYMILTRTAINPVEGEDDNYSWSYKFKIINDVLVQFGAYKSKSHMSLNDLIPQGLIKNLSQEVLDLLI